MKKDKSSLHGNNLFAKAFQEFDEEQFFERLEKRVQPQSYFHKYKGFKNVIATLSYLFNVISAFTASYLVFWLTNWLTGIAFMAYSLSAIFLFFMEQLKRKSSGEFFQVWFFEKKIAVGWLGLSLFVFLASVASTYHGTNKATWDFAPSSPTIVQDSILNNLYTQLSATESQIAEARATRWKGTTTRTSQQTVKELSTQKTLLLTEIERREQGKEGKNKTITQQHFSEIELTATTLAWLTVLFEILFECCIAYIWYYYHRSYIERKLIGEYDKILSVKIPVKKMSDDDVKLLQDLFSNLQDNQNNSGPSFTNKETDQNENGHLKNQFSLPIGYYSKEQRENQLKNLFKHHLGLFKQTKSKNEGKYQERYTIPHRDFKNGQIKHLTIDNVNNRINIYISKIEKAFIGKNYRIIPNQLSKLRYWLRRRKELEGKAVET